MAASACLTDLPGVWLNVTCSTCPLRLLRCRHQSRLFRSRPLRAASPLPSDLFLVAETCPRCRLHRDHQQRLHDGHVEDGARFSKVPPPDSSFCFTLCELPLLPMPCSLHRFNILRAVVSPAKALIPAIRPLLSATLQSILHVVGKVFPHAEQGLRKKTEGGPVLPFNCFLSFWHYPHLFCVLQIDKKSYFINWFSEVPGCVRVFVVIGTEQSRRTLVFPCGRPCVLDTKWTGICFLLMQCAYVFPGGIFGTSEDEAMFSEDEDGEGLLPGQDHQSHIPTPAAEKLICLNR